MTPADRKAAITVEDSDFDASADDDEPTTEAILEHIRRSMKQALAGQTRPAREALAEIRSEIEADADTG